MTMRSLLLPLLLTTVVQSFTPKPQLTRTSRILPSQHNLQNRQHPETPPPNNANNIDRRALLLSPTPLLLPLLFPTSASASSTTQKTPSLNTLPQLPPITHKIRLSVRISRSDGTFYVRDDSLSDDPTDTPFTGTIVLGLFGTIAPNHVSQFLKYVIDAGYTDATPLPSYGRSVFTSLRQTDGLLLGGVVPGLELTSLGGSEALQYGGRIIPAKLWIETKSGGEVRLGHDRRGLLTHRALDLSPEFGITTRAEAELDGNHVVFGRVLLEEEGGGGDEFLRRCDDIKTYSVEIPSVGNTVGSGEGGNEVVAGVATSIFNKQREIFRGAAKSLGDTRLGKVYEGKFLRRVDVTRIELL